MMIMMVNYGVDTFSLIIPKQKYHAASEIIDEITKRGYEREIGKDEYNPFTAQYEWKNGTIPIFIQRILGTLDAKNVEFRCVTDKMLLKLQRKKFLNVDSGLCKIFLLKFLKKNS